MLPDQIVAHLQQLGHRDTRPRRAVVEAISRRRGGAFSAQDIADELADRGIGRATVFRTVNTLQQLGYVSRLHIGGECDRYTVCDGSHHHHLVCTGCGDVFPIESCSVDESAATAAHEIGFSIQGHHVDVFGRCATCREAPQAAAG